MDFVLVSKQRITSDKATCHFMEPLESFCFSVLAFEQTKVNFSYKGSGTSLGSLWSYVNQVRVLKDEGGTLSEMETQIMLEQQQ